MSQCPYQCGVYASDVDRMSLNDSGFAYNNFGPVRPLTQEEAMCSLLVFLLIVFIVPVLIALLCIWTKNRVSNLMAKFHRRHNHEETHQETKE